MTATRPLPPHGTAAATIQHYIDCGMTVQDIARASGCHPNTIQRARKPDMPVSARTIARVAAIRASLSPLAQVPAFGATRRVRAAIAIGHTETAFALEARLGLPYVSELAAGVRPVILASTHDRIDTAYRSLIARCAPEGRGASRARNRARAAKWPTPEQWDDAIDDPDADPASWIRRGDDARTAEELVADAEEIKRTWDVGWDLIAERLGVRRNTLEKARERVRARERAAASQAVAA